MRVDFIRGQNDLMLLSVTHNRIIPDVAWVDEAAGEYGVFCRRAGMPLFPPEIMAIPYKKFGMEIRVIRKAEYRPLPLARREAET